MKQQQTVSLIFICALYFLISHPQTYRFVNEKLQFMLPNEPHAQMQTQVLLHTVLFISILLLVHRYRGLSLPAEGNYKSFHLPKVPFGK